jgi:hypothetical protein
MGKCTMERFEEPLQHSERLRVWILWIEVRARGRARVHLPEAVGITVCKVL